MRLSFIVLIIIILSLLGCKDSINCVDYSVEDCPEECVVCPPCEVCSSVSCQTEEFCESIGFNKSWYEGVKPK